MICKQNILKRKKNELTVSDSYVLAIASGAVVMLVMLTVLPYVSVSYDVGRLFMQTLFITAIPIVVAGKYILQKTRNETYAISVLFAFVFLFISGFVPQLIGGYNPKIALANSGTYYNFFYEHRTDRVGSVWLKDNMDITRRVYLDTDSSSKVPVYVSTGLFHKDIRSGYIYESYRNVTANAYRAFPNGELIEYSYVGLVHGRSLLYVNQGSAVYSPVVKID